MKKTLKTILLLVLALVVCCNAAFAANVPSKTNVTDATATNKDGKEIILTQKETSVTLTEEEAAKIIGDVDAKDLKVLSIRDLTASELPATVTFKTGTDKTIYVFHHNGSKWEVVGKGENGTATVTFDDLSPVALVSRTNAKAADKASSDKSGSGKSYKTGENSIVLAGCTVALAAGAVAILSRKKEA